MPSIRGSSQFRSIKGITVYGVTGNTGPQGPRGNDYYGNTGATAYNIITGITLSGYTLISSFSSGITRAASGKLLGITGSRTVMVGGKTGSTGTGFVFVGASGNTEIILRKLRGSTGYKSLVGITSDEYTLTINVDRYDGGYSLGAGVLSEILATDFNGNLIGVTQGSAKYGSINNTIKINKANVFESARGADQDTNTVIDAGNNVVYLNILDTKTKVLALDVSDTSIFLPGSEYNIAMPKPKENPSGFSLFLQGGTGGTVPNLFWGGDETNAVVPVKFPFNLYPCLATNESYLLHFISGNGGWYGYVFGKGSNSTSTNYFCLDNTSDTQTNTPVPAEAQTVLNFYNGLTGSCCLSDGSCVISTQKFCESNLGFFSGSGTTCGVINSTSVCSESVGACCVLNSADGQLSYQCIPNISPTNCLLMNSDSVKTRFSGINTTCVDIDCSDLFNSLGSCCNGSGNCYESTKEQCITDGGSFAGVGKLCYTDNSNPICADGIGACCTPTRTCGITTAEKCFSSGSYYHGNNTTCSGVTCSGYLGCGGSLGFSLQPGDIIGGGIVVGIYNTSSSMILGGSHAFSRHGSTAEFMYGGETLAQLYQSETDYLGYGITGESCEVLLNNDINSYYIIASLHPASLDSVGNFVDPRTEEAKTEVFPWYGTGIAWGPILHLDNFKYADFTYLDKRYDSLYLRYGEGYYGVTGESLNNIITITFQTCATSRMNGSDPVARLFTRNVKNSNGLWNRNWGIYNTIRMISADNADYKKITSAPYFTFGEFSSGVTMSAIRALYAFDNQDYTNTHGLTANPSSLSDWFIPSHDELAFLAANSITNSDYGININSYLLRAGGIPLSGWHWSSTGSFNTTSNEGIYDLGKPKHGSVAWAIYFDADGDSSKFLVKKENRSEELKVRPIRLMRCDGKTPPINSEQYKLWKTPKLLRNSQ